MPTRYVVVWLLFLATTVNYADRATLSIAGSALAKDLALDPVGMGYVFSAFGRAYVIGQIPGGWLLDRFGSKRVYVSSVLAWSIVTLLQGFVGVLPAALAVAALFSLRLLLGLAEAPSFPGNSRIVSAWFPTAERGTASAIFNSAQYFALVLFSPIMGAITHAFGWRYVFVAMGAIGIAPPAGRTRASPRRNWPSSNRAARWSPSISRRPRPAPPALRGLTCGNSSAAACWSGCMSRSTASRRSPTSS